MCSPSMYVCCMIDIFRAEGISKGRRSANEYVAENACTMVCLMFNMISCFKAFLEICSTIHPDNTQLNKTHFDEREKIQLKTLKC